MGTDDLKAKYPLPVDDINAGGEKVILMACGANFSLVLHNSRGGILMGHAGT